MIMKTTGKSSRTAETRIKDLCASQKVLKNSDGTYSVNQKIIDLPEYIHD